MRKQDLTSNLVEKPMNGSYCIQELDDIVISQNNLN